MEDFKDKAKSMAESAEDIARDKLDTFNKFSREQQILILVFAGIVVAAVVVWILIPSKLNVDVYPIIMDGVMDNQVVVQNLEKKPLGKLKIVINDSYEYSAPELKAEETLSISVTRFRPVGNPDGDPPANDTIPKSVKVVGKGASFKKDFEQK